MSFSKFFFVLLLATCLLVANATDCTNFYRGKADIVLPSHNDNVEILGSASTLLIDGEFTESFSFNTVGDVLARAFSLPSWNFMSSKIFGFENFLSIFEEPSSVFHFVIPSGSDVFGVPSQESTVVSSCESPAVRSSKLFQTLAKPLLNSFVYSSKTVFAGAADAFYLPEAFHSLNLEAVFEEDLLSVLGVSLKNGMYFSSTGSQLTEAQLELLAECYTFLAQNFKADYNILFFSKLLNVEFAHGASSEEFAFALSMVKSTMLKLAESTEFAAVSFTGATPSSMVSQFDDETLDIISKAVGKRHAGPKLPAIYLKADAKASSRQAQCLQLKRALGGSASCLSHKVAESSRRSLDGPTPLIYTAASAQAKSDSKKNSTDDDETFTKTQVANYQIVLWVVIILILAVYASIYAMSSMRYDPEGIALSAGKMHVKKTN